MAGNAWETEDRDSNGRWTSGGGKVQLLTRTKLDKSLLKRKYWMERGGF